MSHNQIHLETLENKVKKRTGSKKKRRLCVCVYCRPPPLSTSYVRFRPHILHLCCAVPMSVRQLLQLFSWQILSLWYLWNVVTILDSPRHLILAQPYKSGQMSFISFCFFFSFLKVLNRTQQSRRVHSCIGNEIRACNWSFHCTVSWGSLKDLYSPISLPPSLSLSLPPSQAPKSMASWMF